MKYISSAFAVMLAALALATPVDAKTLRINVTGDPAMMDPIT